jgi:hypothetical protein
MSDVTCRVCGCTDDHACNPPCAWFEPTLCTTCALAAEVIGAWTDAAVTPSLTNLLNEAGVEISVLDRNVAWSPQRALAGTKTNA